MIYFPFNRKTSICELHLCNSCTWSPYLKWHLAEFSLWDVLWEIKSQPLLQSNTHVCIKGWAQISRTSFPDVNRRKSFNDIWRCGSSTAKLRHFEFLKTLNTCCDLKLLDFEHLQQSAIYSWHSSEYPLPCFCEEKMSQNSGRDSDRPFQDWNREVDVGNILPFTMY